MCNVPELFSVNISNKRKQLCVMCTIKATACNRGEADWVLNLVPGLKEARTEGWVEEGCSCRAGTERLSVWTAALLLLLLLLLWVWLAFSIQQLILPAAYLPPFLSVPLFLILLFNLDLFFLSYSTYKNIKAVYRWASNWKYIWNIKFPIIKKHIKSIYSGFIWKSTPALKC